MKWIKASEKTPPDWEVVCRKISNRLFVITDIDDLEDDHLRTFDEIIYFTDIEWLDETESPDSDGWIGVAKELIELLPYHISPYNLGDEGRIIELILKLESLLPPNK